eukprot:166044-Pyramimonas_sp.AAC.1
MSCPLTRLSSSRTLVSDLVCSPRARACARQPSQEPFALCQRRACEEHSRLSFCAGRVSVRPRWFGRLLTYSPLLTHLLALTYARAARGRVVAWGWQEQEEEVPEDTLARQDGFPAAGAAARGAGRGAERRKASALNDAPSAAKIEELRDLCEQALGDELFIKVYKHLREHMNMDKEDCSADERLQKWLDKELGAARLNHYQIHIFRLIMYEDMVYA